MKINLHFCSIPLISSEKEKCSRQSRREKSKHTFCVFNKIFFFENRAVYETKWKNLLQPFRPQISVWRMRIVCWIPYATNPLPKYIILILY